VKQAWSRCKVPSETHLNLSFVSVTSNTAWDNWLTNFRSNPAFASEFKSMDVHDLSYITGNLSNVELDEGNAFDTENDAEFDTAEFAKQILGVEACDGW
jgi:hypothetical protein